MDEVGNKSGSGVTRIEQLLSEEAIPQVSSDAAISSGTLMVEEPRTIDLAARATELSASDRGGIVTARGTADGLVLRMDGRVDKANLMDAAEEYVAARRGFLANQELSLEWIGSVPSDDCVADLTQSLEEKFGVTFKSSRMLDRLFEERERQERRFRATSQPDQQEFRADESARPRSSRHNEALVSDSGVGFGGVGFGGVGFGGVGFDNPQSLFDGARGLDKNGRQRETRDSALWDDADCRMVYGTLRSGQRVESEHSVVVVGDVNSGAEVISGGDIVVLGTLRGIGHAGAYEETGGGRSIIALNLQPTQLRIGTVISRGAGDGRNQPEIARVEGTLIAVEPYQTKAVYQNKNLYQNKNAAGRRGK